MNVEFRPADEEDERALAQLDRVTWSVSNSPVPLWGEDTDFFTSDLPSDVIVAALDDSIVGYVKVRRNNQLASNAHVLMIGGLAVDPNAQRRGLGASLVQRAINEARTRGAKLLKLHVLETNVVAKRLYQRCGFTVEGVLRNEFLLGDLFVDDVIMTMDLTKAEQRIAPLENEGMRSRPDALEMARSIVVDRFPDALALTGPPAPYRETIRVEGIPVEFFRSHLRLADVLVRARTIRRSLHAGLHAGHWRRTD
jgi:ribosomal protein S18 acetylase RimI-like enzyme